MRKGNIFANKVLIFMNELIVLIIVTLAFSRLRENTFFNK